MAEQPLHLDPDEVTMALWMRPEGTDPEISNEIASVVTEVIRTFDGSNVYVPLDVRFGIAHEVQRRLNVSKKEE